MPRQWRRGEAGRRPARAHLVEPYEGGHLALDLGEADEGLQLLQQLPERAARRPRVEPGGGGLPRIRRVVVARPVRWCRLLGPGTLGLVCARVGLVPLGGVAAYVRVGVLGAVGAAGDAGALEPVGGRRDAQAGAGVVV